jgi:hypothetical protein
MLILAHTDLGSGVPPPPYTEERMNNRVHLVNDDALLCGPRPVGPWVTMELYQYLKTPLLPADIPWCADCLDKLDPMELLAHTDL